MKAGEIHVWRVPLDEPPPPSLPRPTRGEIARAALLRGEEARHRYLRAHRSLRAILRGETAARLEFAIAGNGKPYLPHAPELGFNLSRSREMALVAVARGVEVGVDVERLRPMVEYQAIAERFFTPGDAAAVLETPEPERAREFFRRWTRMEAKLKALGIGLYGAGMELAGEWTVEEIPAGEGFVAAVAAPRAGMTVTVDTFGAGRAAAKCGTLKHN